MWCHLHDQDCQVFFHVPVNACSVISYCSLHHPLVSITQKPTVARREIRTRLCTYNYGFKGIHVHIYWRLIDIGEVGLVRKPVSNTSWMAVVSRTDCHKSVRNCCVKENFGGVFVLSFCFFQILYLHGGLNIVIGLSQISCFFPLSLLYRSIQIEVIYIYSENVRN